MTKIGSFPVLKFAIFAMLWLPGCVSAEDVPKANNEVAYTVTPDGVANLPDSRGRTFRTLDSYLSYLQQYNGPVDLPYWQPWGPDRFRQVTTARDGTEPEIATRAELEERFGFAQAN